MQIRKEAFTLQLLLALLAGDGVAAELGVLRAITADGAQLTIDEGRYRASPAIRLNNLGAGLNNINDAVVGQPVRFTLDSQGRIDELWLYPSRADERQRLGIQLGAEGQ
ncbi:MAG: hypothetical protein OQL08_03160 [Gammaproteobacteria bacterium]|nr:hypothetical protein [Gammaproteobacteria bacterium]